MMRALLVLMVVLFGAVLVTGVYSEDHPVGVSSQDSIGMNSGSGSPGVNLTLQNEMIACFGNSLVAGTGASQSYPAHLALLLHRVVDAFGSPGHTTNDALTTCKTFNDTGYGIIIVTLGTNDVHYWSTGEFPPEQTDANLREIFRQLKGTGAIVVFTEVMGGLDYAGICKEEDVYFLPKVLNEIIRNPEAQKNESAGGDPRLSHGVHPNDLGYGIMAERVAHFLQDEGLVEWVPTERHELDDLLSQASDMIDRVEEKGHNISKMNERYAMAEYLRDGGYLNTAKWELQRIIALLVQILEDWDKIIAMFSEADEAIQVLEKEGKNREAIVSKADYSRAEAAWAEYDYELAITNLQMILARVPEPAFLPIVSILGLILLPTLPRRR